MPLDSNLPTYYFKPPTDKNSFDTSLLYTLFDSDPEPRYILRYPNPAAPQAKNCYAVGLCDPYVSDVVFGEVLVKPEWTQPSVSAEEMRRNGGIPPAPSPVLPKEVTLQLYGPDQQIVLEEEKGGWNMSPTYHFSMPQQTFRVPSASTLDYASSDPAADPLTTQLNFIWRRDGRRELKCYVTGKSTDKSTKKKGGKEPPIIIAIFSDFKELTIYESNLRRVELEDYKGLEIVLLLGATVVRDMFCGNKRDCFNMGEEPRKNNGGVLGLNKKPSKPLLHANASTSNLPATQTNGIFSLGKKNKSTAHLASTSQSPQTSNSHGVPPPDPRQQWEIDAETVRLQKLYAAERQKAEARRREQQRQEQEAQAKIKIMLEQEEKERRRQQAKRREEVDKESARLMKLYGNQNSHVPGRQQTRPHRYSYPNVWSSGHALHPVQPIPRPHSRPPAPPPRPGQGPYLTAPHARPVASQSSFFHDLLQGRAPHMPIRPAASSINLTMSGANGHLDAPPKLKPKKSSLWSFISGDPSPRLR